MGMGKTGETFSPLYHHAGNVSFSQSHLIAVAVLGAGVWLCHRANAAIVIRDDLSEDLLPLMPRELEILGEDAGPGPALG